MRLQILSTPPNSRIPFGGLSPLSGGFQDSPPVRPTGRFLGVVPGSVSVSEDPSPPATRHGSTEPHGGQWVNRGSQGSNCSGISNIDGSKTSQGYDELGLCKGLQERMAMIEEIVDLFISFKPNEQDISNLRGFLHDNSGRLEEFYKRILERRLENSQTVDQVANAFRSRNCATSTEQSDSQSCSVSFGDPSEIDSSNKGKIPGLKSPIFNGKTTLDQFILFLEGNGPFQPSRSPSTLLSTCGTMSDLSVSELETSQSPSSQNIPSRNQENRDPLCQTGSPQHGSRLPSLSSTSAESSFLQHGLQGANPRHINEGDSDVGSSSSSAATAISKADTVASAASELSKTALEISAAVKEFGDKVATALSNVFTGVQETVGEMGDEAGEAANAPPSSDDIGDLLNVVFCGLPSSNKKPNPPFQGIDDFVTYVSDGAQNTLDGLKNSFEGVFSWR